MTDLIPLAIGAAIILAVLVALRVRAGRKARAATTSNLASTVNGSNGRPGADKH